MDTWCLTQWKHCKAHVICVQTKQFPLSNIERIKAKCHKFLTKAKVSLVFTFTNPDFTRFYEKTLDIRLYFSKNICWEHRLLLPGPRLTLVIMSDSDLSCFSPLRTLFVVWPGTAENWKGLIYIFKIIWSVSLAH